MGNDSSLERLMPPELAEEYEPLALLKEGAERQTLLLRDRASGEKLVLKRILRAAEDVEKKYALLSRLAGDGIPKMRRFFRSGDAVYLLREYIEGETLLDLVQKRGPFPAEETAWIGLALCRTLGRLHSQDPPLIHRDIKAENIIRTPAGEYVLIDFDISRFYDEQDSRDTELRGTAFSAPPEQFGFRQTDPRSDIYALGVLLHELATGESRLGQGETPAPLRAAVNRCTRFDPKDRYQSVTALERALKRAAAGRKGMALRAAMLVMAVVLALGAVTAAALAGRKSQAEDIYTFQSPAIEAEVCRQLQKEPGAVTCGDLEGIASLLLCGEVSFDSWEQIDVHGTDITLDGAAQFSEGTVDTLEDLRNFPNLLELALCNQRITDLSPLAGSNVRRVALHGNRISDLSPLGSCVRLEELVISDNPVSDLSPLAQCTALWNLNVGATETEDLDAVAAIPNLSFLGVHDCPHLTDVSVLGAMEGLRYLSIRPAGTDTLALIGGMDQLEHLYVWVSDTQTTDLTGLSGLSNLTRLFVDMPAISSLDGVENLKKLQNLDVRSSGRADVALDPEPLRDLAALEDLNAACLDIAALADVLPALPALRHVSCAAGQRAALSRMLTGRPEVELTAY